MVAREHARTFGTARCAPSVLGLVAFLFLGGCLFPPIEEIPGQPGEVPDPDGPREAEGPLEVAGGGTEVRNGTYQDAGKIENAATVGDQAVATERHTHELPPGLIGFTLSFEWDAETGEDLDLALEIQSDGVAVWNHTVDGGRTGFPDAPVELSFPDLGEDLVLSDPGLLVIDVSAEVTLSTLYAYAGTYTYRDRTT